MKTSLLRATLALLFVALLPLNMFATIYTGSCGTNVSYRLDTSTGSLVISGTGDMKDYDTGDDDPSPWSRYRSYIKNVTIQNGVTRIGDDAFDECSSIVSVTIAGSVKNIGEDAFAECTSLKSIDIPYGVVSIEDDAFWGCTSLSSVTISESVAYIEDIFCGCSSLPVVDGCRYADTYLVEAMDKTLSTYSIKQGTRFIGRNAFSGCSNMTSIVIPNSVIDISFGAFDGCSGLPVIDGCRYADKCLVQATDRTQSTYSIKQGTRLIGGDAFSGCSNMTSIVIPNSVTNISERAFERCTGLTSVTIPNSVTSIGIYAFSGCRGLTSCTIPNSVISIGYGAFSGCSGLTSLIIPNSVTYIGISAFRSCSGLTSLIIPNSVTSIGEFAFPVCM